MFAIVPKNPGQPSNLHRPADHFCSFPPSYAPGTVCLPRFQIVFRRSHPTRFPSLNAPAGPSLRAHCGTLAGPLHRFVVLYCLSALAPYYSQSRYIWKEPRQAAPSRSAEPGYGGRCPDARSRIKSRQGRDAVPNGPRDLPGTASARHGACQEWGPAILPSSRLAWPGNLPYIPRD